MPDPYAHLIGKTVILFDGTEDVITGRDADAGELISATRRWSHTYAELTSGDPAQKILCFKQKPKKQTFKITFGGEFDYTGGFVAQRLVVESQYVGALLVHTYNQRTQALVPTGAAPKLWAQGPQEILVDGDCVVDFQDDEALQIIASDEVFEFGWKPPQDTEGMTP